MLQAATSRGSHAKRILSLLSVAIDLDLLRRLQLRLGAGHQHFQTRPRQNQTVLVALHDETLLDQHRATADPAIVLYQGDYYLFSTNQGGYWWSSDMSQWHFVPRKFLKPENELLKTGEKIYDDLYAPATFVMDNALFVIGSTYTPDFPIWKSTNPKADEWTEATPAFSVGAWDPAFFLDDDGRLYLYYGSSNDKPIYG
ncbi:hypothetical protein B4Q13_17265, partial [Lacticaseibacillus rhamnosus]